MLSAIVAVFYDDVVEALPSSDFFYRSMVEEGDSSGKFVFNIYYNFNKD